MGRRTVEDTATKVRRFNDWIRGELKRQKKNQTELAYYIGTDQSGLSLRMNEKRTWTLKEYFNVLEFFGKKAEDAEW
jgi:hypothetical protein